MIISQKFGIARSYQRADAIGKKFGAGIAILSKLLLLGSSLKSPFTDTHPPRRGLGGCVGCKLVGVYEGMSIKYQAKNRDNSSPLAL
jgi:hypothetical protein